MASSIGVRVYLISLQRRSKPEALPFNISGVGTPPLKFISDFVLQHAKTTENADHERSWSFEEKSSNGSGNSKGHIYYGTFGFESDFVDAKTRKRKYRRGVTDTEIIPLFYEFWHPKDADYSFAVFQSFQGRSCVNLVMTRMQEVFSTSSPGFALRFKKILPTDNAGSLYNSPVKKITLIKKNASADLSSLF